MKILIINSVCGIRSTGRICTDLAAALEAEGHTVKIGYGRENVPEQFKKYAVKIDSDIENKLHGLKARLCDADGRGSTRATKKFLNWVKEYDPDVIHLNNLHGYYINVPLLFDYIIKNDKKVIWTLHDMWPFTGHFCTCDLADCEKWESGCGKCPRYRQYPASFVDRSKKNFIWKKELFCRVKDLTIVTPSKWLAELTKRSFLGKKRIRVIPNGIDISLFKPLDNDFKARYGTGNKILIMGSAEPCGSEIELGDFIKLSEGLDERYKLVLTGLSKEQIDNLPDKILGLERSSSAKEAACVYSAADSFVNLSYSGKGSELYREAAACGTPVVTYSAGGNAQGLNKKNFKVFEAGDIEGIIRCFNNELPADMPAMSGNSQNDKGTSASECPAKNSNGYFEVRSKYNMSGKTVVLGVAAYWNDRKGIRDFIRLARQLPKEYMTIMVGVTKDVRPMLPANITAIERTDSVEELRELYAASDVFVNPTVQDNYPTVNLEAVACGTPVVTYNTGGSPENSYTPSCVVKQKDYDALKSIILNRKFENAIELESVKSLGKEMMKNRYIEAYNDKL